VTAAEAIGRVARRREMLALAAAAAITLATLAFDLSAPAGIAAAVPYALVVVLTLASPRRRTTWIAAAGVTVLAVVGELAKLPHSAPWTAAYSRSVTLVVIWVTAALVLLEKRRAAQIERERLALARSESLASLGRMAAGIAHELGNPLAALRGRLEMLEMKLDSGALEPAELRPFTSSAMATTDRMIRIIRGMRTLARDASSDPLRNAPIGRLARDAAEFARARLEKNGIALRLGAIDETLEVPCREAQIGQVLVNLLSNAADAIQDLPERWIEVSVADRRDHVEIAVTDSGPGIPAALRDQVMEPFFTTKDVGEGTGLGLSISRSILEDHDGTLAIDERCPNTRFVLSIPKRCLGGATPTGPGSGSGRAPG
jgi:C4-dicarboxylate-specific signal transduction histidine kinase